jgi:hypothetical protein
LARYFYDTRIREGYVNESIVKAEEYLTTEHTVDDLYKLAYPEFHATQAELYSLPLKYVLDSIMTQNVLVDFKENTKRLSAAHFDNEAFMNGSRRILQFRQTSSLIALLTKTLAFGSFYLVINQTRDNKTDLKHAREILGQLFHTLQDFYSHSNWVEMGNTDINQLIGSNETIGSIAALNQSTCTSNGCRRIEKTCVCLLRDFTCSIFFLSDNVAAN